MTNTPTRFRPGRLLAALGATLLLAGLVTAAPEQPAAPADSAGQAQDGETATTQPAAPSAAEQAAMRAAINQRVRARAMERITAARATTQPGQPEPLPVSPAGPPLSPGGVAGTGDLPGVAQPGVLTPADLKRTRAQPGHAPPNTPVGLEPPPPDQPQPKLYLPETKVALVGIWAGETAKFAFEIGNDGPGVLAYNVEGGG